MSKFVKLTLHDGREIVRRIADIVGVSEMPDDVAAKEFRTGCVRVLFDNQPGAEFVEGWLIGTVDDNLAKIRDAEKEGNL